MSASQGGLLCWQLGQLCAQGISLYGKMMQPLWDLGLSCVLVITIKVALHTPVHLGKNEYA